jgi:hypothetical protein
VAKFGGDVSTTRYHHDRPGSAVSEFLIGNATSNEPWI